MREVRVGLRFGSETWPVGRLAMSGGTVYFEYDPSFLARGLEISPLRLPLKPGLQSFRHAVFEGLPGVFGDSLPDGWGRLLLDRAARAQGVLPEELGPLDRLAHVGASGMGALVYEPDYAPEPAEGALDLDRLADGAKEVLGGEAPELLETLISLNGSSAGARPKAMIGVDAARSNAVHGRQDLPGGFEPWLVKFGNSRDGGDAGAAEYVFSLMARQAGVDMPDTHLFPSRDGAGHFAVRRFDRTPTGRLHMHSAAGLLHADFRAPSLDYRDLAALTLHLTRDVREVERLVRLAVFNVLGHNRDDHAKNFSFLMDASGEWRLSPAYDITFSGGPGGQQSTLIMGEGANPTGQHLVALGEEAGLDGSAVREMIDRTRQALSRWPELASEHGVFRQTRQQVQRRIQQTSDEE